jgi:orotidine-5'-phosphate decarboxylase
MENKVKIFFPVDVPTLREGYKLLEEVAEYVDIIKIGLELLSNVGPHAAIQMGPVQPRP